MFVPNVIGEVHSNNWEIRSTINNHDTNFNPVVEIDYSRPLSIRLLVSILLFSLLLIIVFSMLIKDIATYLGVLLGILLGMDGLRPIMKSPEISGFTILDVFFLSFYILIGITLFMRFVIFSLWKFSSQESTKPILLKSKIVRKKNPNNVK